MVCPEVTWLTSRTELLKVTWNSLIIQFYLLTLLIQNVEIFLGFFKNIKNTGKQNVKNLNATTLKN